MSTDKIDSEYKARIIEAANDLVSRGVERPTNQQIREALGGGSYSTINPVMREWREEQQTATSTTIPEEVKRAIEVQGAQIWLAANRYAQADVERLQKSIEEVKAGHGMEVASLQEEVDRLEQHLTEERAERAEADNTAAEYREKIVRLEEKHEAVRTEHRKVTEALAASQDQNESERDRFQNTATELELAKERQIHLQTAVNTLQEELTQRRADFSRVERKAEILEEQRRQDQSRLEQTDIALREALAAQQTAEAKVADANSELRLMEERLKSTNERLKESRSELASERSSHADTRRSLETANNALMEVRERNGYLEAELSAWKVRQDGDERQGA